MPCYAKNPVLLYTTGCRRTVCIHCRIDVRMSPLPETGTEQCEVVLSGSGARPAIIHDPR